MKVAVNGLGRMGMQIAQRLVEDDHEVIGHNRSPDKVDYAATFGAKKAYTKEDVINYFNDDRVFIWLMVPADAVDSELEDWLRLLKEGDVIIDGGNSFFQDTIKRAENAKSKGIELIDVGTSGGILGLTNGFSMMVGGDSETVKLIEPLLLTLSKPNGGYQYFGQSGSGNYVKMIHNAIEYGMMESLAEGYRMLKEGPIKNIDLAAAGNVWQRASIIQSALNGLTAEILKENSDLHGIDGFVAETGEARWTLAVAEQLGIELPSIKSAYEVRIASQQGKVNFATKLLAAIRNKFGGHKINKDE